MEEVMKKRMLSLVLAGPLWFSLDAAVIKQPKHVAQLHEAQEKITGIKMVPALHTAERKLTPATVSKLQQRAQPYVAQQEKSYKAYLLKKNELHKFEQTHSRKTATTAEIKEHDALLAQVKQLKKTHEADKVALKKFTTKIQKQHGLTDRSPELREILVLKK